MNFYINILIVWCICIGPISGSDTEIPIVAKSNRGKEIELGSFSNNREIISPDFIAQDDNDVEEFYCIGLKGKPCMIYTKLSASTFKNVQLQLLLNDDGSINGLALQPRKSTMLDAETAKEAPSPVFDTIPEETAKEQKTESNEDIKEPSWIQKNWVYIVPPLIILFMLLPEETPDPKKE